jgi:hypothetical protein
MLKDDCAKKECALLMAARENIHGYIKDTAQ